MGIMLEQLWQGLEEQGSHHPLVVVAGVHGMAEGDCHGGGAGAPGAALGGGLEQ